MRGLNPVVGCDEWMTVTAKQIARPVEPLSPSDSIAHAVEQMRLSGLSVYPIVRNGTFVAMVSLETIDRYLERDWDFDIDRVRLSPVALTISDTVLIGVEQSTACIGGNYPISSATQVFRSVGDPDSLAVVEGNGTYVGLLVRSDLIAARIRTLAPHRMGGMATPLGVYLTDGINAGGAGTLGRNMVNRPS